VAVKPIVLYGNAVLREISKPVDINDRKTKDLVADLIATLKDARGLGLAAPQIGESARIFIIDLTAIDLTESIRVFINPEILETSGEILLEEGCLSFPDIFQKIVRPEKVTIKATGLDGKEFTQEASGMLARAMLHEYDHLDGKLFIDYFSTISRSLINGKLKRLKKMTAAS
jgi:peptide deformylase